MSKLLAILALPFEFIACIGVILCAISLPVVDGINKLRADLEEANGQPLPPDGH